MNTITYRPCSIGSGLRRESVFLDGEQVGMIMQVPGGFQYYPCGDKLGGDVLPTIESVKRSLEGQ